MKRTLLSMCIVTSLFAAQSWASEEQDHAAHHPDQVITKPASKAMTQPTQKPAPKSNDAMSMPCMQMGNQMKAMQEMHAKFMGAKTQEERNALMEEHMKSMQSGMSMMSEMGGAKDGKGEPMSMQMRMDMMEMMMKMMMDRMSAMPTK